MLELGSVELVLVIAVLGFIAAYLSGMLGIGGAMVLAPLLLYVPPLLKVAAIDMKTVAGVSAVQVVVATASGAALHRRSGYVNGPLVLWMGSGTGIGALAGALASSGMDSMVLTTIFAALLVISFVLMVMPLKHAPADHGQPLCFNRPLAVACSLVTGALAGMVGIGGAGITMAVMLRLLRVPIRTAVGTSLGITFVAAIATMAGKLGTGQVDLLLAAALVAGTLPGVPLGVHFSRRSRPVVLRLSLAVLVALMAARMLYDLLPQLVGAG